MSFIPVETHEELQAVLKRVISSKKAVTERIIAEKIGDADIAEQIRKFQAPTVDAIAKQTREQSLLSGEQHKALLEQLEEKTKALRESIEAIPAPIVSRLGDAITKITGTNTRLDSIEKLADAMSHTNLAQFGVLRDMFKDNKQALDAIELAIQIQTDRQSASNIIKSNLDTLSQAAWTAMEDGEKSQAQRRNGDALGNEIGAPGQKSQLIVMPDPTQTGRLVLRVITPKSKGNQYLYAFTEGLAHLLYATNADLSPSKYNITANDALIYLDIVRQSGIPKNNNPGEKLKHIKAKFRKDMMTITKTTDTKEPAYKYLWDHGPTQYALAYGLNFNDIVSALGASIKQAPPDPVTQPAPAPTAPPPNASAETIAAWRMAVRDGSAVSKPTTDVGSAPDDPVGDINGHKIEWTEVGGEQVLQLTHSGGKRNYKATPGLAKLLYIPDNKWATTDKSDVTFTDAMMYLDIIKTAGHKKQGGEKPKWVQESTKDIVDPGGEFGNWRPQDLAEFYHKGPREYYADAPDPAAALETILPPGLITGSGIIGNWPQGSFEGGALSKRKKARRKIMDDSDPYLALRPLGKMNPKSVAGLQKAVQASRNAYKVKPLGNGWGEFGNIYINLDKLNKHPSKLRARGRGGDKVISGDAHPDLSELLFKRFNPRKQYDGGAVNMFKQLVNLSGLPPVLTSGKYKLITGGDIIAPAFPYSWDDLGANGGSFEPKLQRSGGLTIAPDWSRTSGVRTHGPESLGWTREGGYPVSQTQKAYEKSIRGPSKSIFPEFPQGIQKRGGTTNDPTHRLGILLGNLAAGGNSPEVFNEALDIINYLRKSQIITEEHFKHLLAKLRNLVA